MFITFEGIEGCGKTTQIRLLAHRLQQYGYEVLLTREPGGCPISDKIRAILLDAENSSMSPPTELLLYCAARAQHVSQVIQPALNSGTIVLCDRFSDATIAYQHFARGLERVTLQQLIAFAENGVTPHLTILIDGDIESCLTRAKSRIASTAGPKEERFELESIEFHKRVSDGYRQLALEFPDRITLIDGRGSIENLADHIFSVVKQKIEATKRVI